MTTFLRCLAILLALSSLASPALPADIEGQKPVMFVGDAFQFVPGAWSRYTVRDTAKGEQYRLWIATLAKGKASGGPSSWMEIEVVMADTPTVVTRFLVRETPQGPGELLDVIVQMKGYTPFVVPKKYYRGQDKQVGNFQAAHVLRRVGERTLTLCGRDIPVVDVEAQDAAGKPVTATVSEAVLPIGVVAAEANGMTMTLEDWGADGKSRLDGSPMNFYLWLLMQVGQGVFK